jgi:hypothetical protein
MRQKKEQQKGQNDRIKVNSAYMKVSNAYSKVNRANTQSRQSGILCALAHGKLYFALLTSFSAAQNHLPRHGEDLLRSRKSFQKLVTKGSVTPTKIQAI